MKKCSRRYVIQTTNTQIRPLYTLYALTVDDRLQLGCLWAGDAMKLIRRLQSTNTGDLSYQLFKHYPKRPDGVRKVTRWRLRWSHLISKMRVEHILEETASTSTGAPEGADFWGHGTTIARVFDGSHVQMLESGVTIYQGEDDDVEEHQEPTAFMGAYKRGLWWLVIPATASTENPHSRAMIMRCPAGMRHSDGPSAPLNGHTNIVKTTELSRRAPLARSQSASSSVPERAILGDEVYLRTRIPSDASKVASVIRREVFPQRIWMPKNNGRFFRGRFKSRRTAMPLSRRFLR